jgi:hypothetical protein
MLVCETPHVIPRSMTTRGLWRQQVQLSRGTGGARTRRVPSAARMAGVGDRDMVSRTRTRTRAGSPCCRGHRGCSRR